MEIQFSSVKRRFAAIFLDGIILTFFLNITLLYFPSSEFIVAILIPFLYYVILYSVWEGQTIGKHIMSIKVVRVDNQPITVGTAFIRTFGYYISVIPVFLGFLWALWDKEKQTFHDKLAKTYVVKTETSPKRMLWIILVVVLMFVGMFSFGLNTVNTLTQIDGTILTEQDTQEVSTETSIRSKLNLEYIKYDGSGEASLIEAFNSPDLEEILNSIQELEEDFVEVGDGNMNIAGDEIILEKESTVYIKLTTDTEVAAFIFTKENLDAFVREQERQENPFEFKQNVTDFLPSYKLKSSYTKLILEAGTYQLVIVPTKKAVTIDTVIKI